jgi:hypothetical protein
MAPSAGKGGLLAMSAAASGGVFISYRRQEASAIAGRLYDRLAARFGDDQVFMDVDNIALGVDFAEVITQEVSTCQVLLAVIGPRWLTATDEGGRRRLDNPDDIVRLEIAAALERDIRVIPILVEGAVLPHRQELPEELAGLARRNSLSLRHESFHSDADRLLTAIEPILRRAASEAPDSSGPARLVTSLPRPTETNPTAEASSRPDPGGSSTQVRVLQHPSKWGLLGSKAVFSVAFSRDGGWLATGCDGKTAWIWDAHSGQHLHTLSHNDHVRPVAFSPDGRWLATGSKDDTARIWDAHSGQQLHILRHNNWVWAVAFSPDGRLATGTGGDRAVLWEITPPSHP